MSGQVLTLLGLFCTRRLCLSRKSAKRWRQVQPITATLGLATQTEITGVNPWQGDRAFSVCRDGCFLDRGESLHVRRATLQFTDHAMEMGTFASIKSSRQTHRLASQAFDHLTESREAKIRLREAIVLRLRLKPMHVWAALRKKLEVWRCKRGIQAHHR